MSAPIGFSQFSESSDAFSRLAASKPPSFLPDQGKPPFTSAPPWAELLSESSLDPDYKISSNDFLIGSHRRCNHMVFDDDGPEVILRIKKSEHEGSIVGILTRTSSVVVKVNGDAVGSQGKKLNSGDEIIFETTDSEFDTTGSGGYIFYIAEKECSTVSTSHLASVKKRIQDAITRDFKFTFDNLPYRLGDASKNVLIGLCKFFFHKKEIAMKYSCISSINPNVLLLCPRDSEAYQDMLVQALANHFNAHLLIFDRQSIMTKQTSPSPERFSSGDRVVYIGKENRFRSGDELVCSGPVCRMHGKVVLAFEHNPQSKIGVNFDKVISDGVDMGRRCERNRGFFCNCDLLLLEEPQLVDIEEKILIKILFEVISIASENHPFILFIKDTGGAKSESYWKSFLDQNNIIAICSYTSSENVKDIPEHLRKLFPNDMHVRLPQDLASRKIRLEQAAKTLDTRISLKYLQMAIKKSTLRCEDLDKLRIEKPILTEDDAESVIGVAISRPESGIDSGVLTLESITSAIEIQQARENEIANDYNCQQLDMGSLDEYEKKVLEHIVPPNDIMVLFKDIGNLEYVKDELKGLIILPLLRPELFSKGALAKPCKGILLFGPPGSGKTMLAKAVATETHLNFINVPISSVTSKDIGESEKYVKAVFTLASKLAPSIIFIDEVDSILGRRQDESESSRRVRTEFMINWDGVLTKGEERVMVIGATNRPYDLEDAVIRRFERRMMLNLPDASDRARILGTILSKEELNDDVDLDEIARLTEGFSSSDLVNLCHAAALVPIKELIKQEKEEHQRAVEEGQSIPPLKGRDDLRSLKLRDFRSALRHISASTIVDPTLEQWNLQFGDRRKK